MQQIIYWLFEEDRLMLALAAAVACGDLTDEEAYKFKRFMTSAHAEENKLIFRQTIRFPGEGL